MEIDARVTEAGRRLFAMDNPRLRTFDQDARPFLRRSAGGYDLIGIDAYRQPYIPFYLATREFFALVRSRLAPGGAVMVNVGHPPGQDGLERVLAATIGAEFANVARYPIEAGEHASDRVQLRPEPRPAGWRRAAPAGRAAPGASRRRGSARTAAAGRSRLHRRPRTGGVADRHLDRVVRCR